MNLTASKRTLAAGALAALIAVSGCGSSERTSILEEGARFPDVEGVVTKISRKQVTIDGKETYPFKLEVESFRTFEGHEAMPLIHLSNTYVHIGLEDDEVIWIAGIGLAAPDQPVVYPGVYERTEEGRAIFRDGTTLALAKGVKVPKKGTTVVAQIDPAKDQVTSLQKQ